MSLRNAVTSVLACTALVGLAWPAAATPTPVAADEKVAVAGDRAFSEIASCISSADTLLAVVVVDESGSLQSTDPDAMRVPAITSAIDALKELKASAPGRLNVQVSMSTFARGYDELVGWGELNARHADRLRATATDELPQRNSGDATDYRQALKGAQRQLDTRAVQLADASACKVMLWFTDGALDVDSSTTDALEELCRPQGIVDAVRGDHISVVTLALFTAGGEVTDAQRDQLRAVAEGTGEAATCGKTPIAPDARSGVYLSAEDPAALRRLFAGATALISGATPGPTTDCPNTNCPDGSFSFDVDPGVGGFRVVADVGADGARPTLVTPDGERLLLPVSGSASLAVEGGSLEAFARDGLVTATMVTNSLPARSTRWQVDLGREGGGVDLYWYWGAELRLKTPELVAGSGARLRGSITGPDAQPLDAQLYRELDVRAVVGSEAAAVNVESDGSFSADVALPADSASSEAMVKVTATAQTRGSDIDLGPLTLSETAPISLPPAFPSLTPTRLQLAGLEGLGTRTAVLGLTGSKLGSTRVCFTGSTVAAPGGARVEATPASGECVDLTAGEQSELRIDLVPETIADGVAAGDLTFNVTGAENSGTVEVSVPTEFGMSRSVDESTRWLLVALLVGLALVIPALLLLISEWLLSRFAITPTHQTAVVPVRLTKSGPERATDNDEALLVSNDLTNLSLTRVRSFRRYAVPRTNAVLRVRPWWDFWRGSRGVVTVGQGRLVASKIPPFSRRAGREADVGLGAANLWFVVTDSGTVRDSEIPQATLVVLFPTDYVPLSERVADIRGARWESILEMLAAHAAATSPSDDSSQRPDGTANADHLAGGAVPSWMQPSGAVPPTNSTGSDLPSWLSGDETASPPPASTGGGSVRIRRNRRSQDPPANPSTDDLPPMDFLKQ